jgi:hypothetical protein
VAGAGEVVERGRAGVFQGGLTVAVRGAAEAGLAAAAGRTADALIGFVESISALRDATQLVHVVRCELSALRLLPDVPEASAWAEEVRSLSEAAGANSLLEQLDRLRATSAGLPAQVVATTTEPVSDAT